MQMLTGTPKLTDELPVTTGVAPVINGLGTNKAKLSSGVLVIGEDVWAIVRPEVAKYLWAWFDAHQSDKIFSLWGIFTFHVSDLHNLFVVLFGADPGPTPVPTPVSFSLGVSGAGTGSGSVVSSPSGINATISRGVGSDSASYPTGTVVTLSANPAVGSVFAGFSGAVVTTSPTCQVAMNQVQSVVAIFNTTP